ncbi:MAG: AMP-binding protein, partial [Desulfobacterales bacterium]|nr:AMP-binding protein [Desulfobacterales bacterium]
MMDAVGDFLPHLRKLNVKLWTEGEDLCYTAPEGVMTRELLGELAGRKEEITAFLMEADHALRAPSDVIGSVPRDENPALSFAQERLWFLDQLEPENPFYNVYGAFHLVGRLDVPALKRSLDEIVRRHEALRTTFTAIDGKPVQVIAPPSEAAVRVEQPWATLEETPRETVMALAEEEAKKPFDLEKGPLFRSLLLRIGPGEHALIFNMHHIVSDGWSLGIATREIIRIYDAFSRGLPSPLPPLSVQYPDFAAWHRKWFRGEEPRRQMTWWKALLADAPPELKLPTDRPRPAAQSHQGDSLQFRVPRETTAALRAIGQEAEATLFMTLLAAFAALLSRYTRQTDMVIGSPIANRNRKEIEPLIGFFVNTLALRADLSGDPDFRTLLARVRELSLNAFANQDLPFEKLVDELQPERDLSRNPLFQVMFAFQNAPSSRFELKDLKARPLEMKWISSLFDLDLDMWEEGDELVGILEYNTDLFDASTIRQMADCFLTLLSGAARDPRQKISRLPLLTREEQGRLLAEGRGPALSFPIHEPLHRLFEERVRRTPGRVAVRDQGRLLTYDRLNRRANRIARLLRRLGAGRGGLVGILDDRGVDFLSAMLGALKAGAAYVPLDPDYPRERVRHMLVDSGVEILVTRSTHLERIRTEKLKDLRRAVLLDRGDPAGPDGVTCYGPCDLAKEDPGNPAPVNTGEDLAYMIYTSGSTGAPKG